jgi:hypothetical protein
VIEALVAGRTVALTTGLTGAGGFGKSMLAARACLHRDVTRRYKGGIVWFTVGRETDEATLAARIGETARILGGAGEQFTGLEQAGQALSAALAARGGPILLVVDDVWDGKQLAPFRAAAQVATLLVTTRRPQVLDTIDLPPRRIVVDAVDGRVSRRILRRGLPSIARAEERELMNLARGYPLLLNLINRRLAHDLRVPGGVIGAAAAEAARRLRNEGRPGPGERRGGNDRLQP